MEWRRKSRRRRQRWLWKIWMRYEEKEKIVEWKGEEKQRKGVVNVLRDRVIVSIHHYSRLQMFCKPQLQLHAPITFLRPASTTHTITHTLTLFTGNPPRAYTENKLNNAPHIPIIENLFTHSHYSSHIWSIGLQTHCIYSSCACKERH